MENKAAQAIALREKGYNCAQAVVCAYCEEFGVDEQTAYKLAEGFGLGMGLMEVCGALSGAFMLSGMKMSGGTAHPGETKGATYQKNKAIAAAFQEQNGTLLCRELKGVTDGNMRRSCPGCIEDACKLVSEILAD